MKIYEFPTDPEKRKAGSSREKTKSADVKNLVHPPLYGEGGEEYEEIDIGKINRVLFFRYLQWFPSFQSFRTQIQKQDLEALFDYYSDENVFTEPQEIIFEFLIELLSPYDCGFMIKEMYMFLSVEDRDALLKVLSDFSNFVR